MTPCKIRSANYCAPEWECAANGLCHREREPLGGFLPKREREPSYLEKLGYPPISNGEIMVGESQPKRRVRLS